MNRIDASYRLLLGNPHLVRDLFQGIVNEPWVAELDWDGLRPLPREFVSDSLRQPPNPSERVVLSSLWR